MMKKLKKQPQKMDHIGIHRIIFDQSEWVTLWGFKLVKGRKVPMDYVINFDLFNKLLRLSGPDGDPLQMLIVEKLETGEFPSVIDLNQQLGGPVFFNRCILEISPTWIKDDTGVLREDPFCLSIDAVYPLMEKRVQKLSCQTLCRQNLVECEELLAASYALYLGYLELDMSEETALEEAELEDDLKFKMAYYAWKMNAETV